MNSPITQLFTNPAGFVAFVLSLVIAIALHEFSHAAAAVAQGDPTPRQQGRLTLNPIRHLDPFGSLMMLVAGFGYGKPVEFRPGNLRYRRWGSVLVSIVGPLSNLVLAFAAAGLYALASRQGWLLQKPNAETFLRTFFQINTILAIFNLIPIPPLDGSRLLEALLPPSAQGIVEFLNRYGIFILLAIVFLPSLTGQPSLLGPLFTGAERLILGVFGLSYG